MNNFSPHYQNLSKPQIHYSILPPSVKEELLGLADDGKYAGVGCVNADDDTLKTVMGIFWRGKKNRSYEFVEMLDTRYV